MTIAGDNLVRGRYLALLAAHGEREIQMPPLREMVAGLCEYLRIPPVEATDDGRFEIVFDQGLEVEMLQLSDSQSLIRAEIAATPEEKHEQESFFRSLLQNNLLNLQVQNASLALDSERGVIWLFQTLPNADIDQRQFNETVGYFVNSLEWWKNLGASKPSTPPGDMMSFQMLRP